jgi:hypothetical protein
MGWGSEILQKLVPEQGVKKNTGSRIRMTSIKKKTNQKGVPGHQLKEARVTGHMYSILPCPPRSLQKRRRWRNPCGPWRP